MNKQDHATAPARIVPFSHFDLFWTGTREECLSRGNFIISQALDLLEKHEDFRFLIETVNFLDHYISCYPADKERIRSLAQTGRLELAPLWSGIYLNLPGGETLARNTLLGKRYVRRHFGCDPLVAHFGDLPGYTAQYPQIAKLAGIRYVLMSRGGPGATPLFDWEGLDGQTVRSFFVPWGYALLAMCTDWHKDFQAMVSGRLQEILQKQLQGKNYPCLFHWGSDLYAPNENIITNLQCWNQEMLPRMKFSTLTEYFTETERVSDVPRLKGELPSFWPNVESTWPQIWPEDMPCEAALHMAEFLSVFCLTRGWNDYPQAELDDAWKALLDGMDHNQNCQGGSRADGDKLQLKRHSRYAAERIADRMAWRLAAEVPVPRGDMFPVVVFNSMSWRRTGLTIGRAGVFGSVRSSDIGAFDDGLQLVDENGKVIPYVQLERYEGLSVMMEIAFTADVPATGYRTYYLVPGKNPVDADTTCHITLDAEADRGDPNKTARYSTDRVVPTGPRRNMGANLYESPFFRIELDVVTGDWSVFDRRSQTMLFDKVSITGVEERRGNYISDMTASGRDFPALFDGAETIDNNTVWCRIRLRGSVYGMPFTQVITLHHDTPEIAVANEIDWQESRWVRIQQVFSYAGTGATIRYGVPYGFITYPQTLTGAGKGQSDEIDTADYNRLRLCRHWIDIGDGTDGATIAADHRMWEFQDRTLRSYMVRGAGHCGGVKRTPSGELQSMSHPPAGRYRFQYLIRPRTESLETSASYRCGWELNHPFRQTAVCGSKNTASLPATLGLLDWTDTSLVLTAVKKAEDGNAIVVRGFEATGRSTRVPSADLGERVARESNLLEESRRPPSPCRPFEIKTLVFE